LAWRNFFNYSSMLKLHVSKMRMILICIFKNTRENHMHIEYLYEVVLQFHRSGPPELWTHQITICSRTLAGEFLNAWRKFPCLITLRTVSGLAMNSSCMHIIHRESNDKFMWKMDVSTTFYLCIFFLSLLLFVFPLGTEGMRMPWTIGIVAFTKCSQCLNFMWKVQLKQNNSCS